jgi:hypothetical protein
LNFLAPSLLFSLPPFLMMRLPPSLPPFQSANRGRLGVGTSPDMTTGQRMRDLRLILSKSFIEELQAGQRRLAGEGGQSVDLGREGGRGGGRGMGEFGRSLLVFQVLARKVLFMSSQSIPFLPVSSP